MDYLINQHNKILLQLEELNQISKDKKLNKNTIKKIGIINDKLVNISDTLTNLNINLKLDNQIKLTDSERDHLKCEKDSNNLIGRIMPALALLSIGDNIY